MSLIRLTDIDYSVGGPPLLDGASLAIEPGERVCLIGRNGVGKSTLLRIIEGSLTPEAGRLQYAEGIRVTRLEQAVPADLDGRVFEVVSAGLGELGGLLARHHDLSEALAAGEGDARALGDLQAAIEAGEQYNEERDQALEDLLDTWEKANAATVINYCHQTLDKLSETNLTDEQIGSGLHSYSEAVGFLHGWRTIPSNYKLITDGEIEQLLVKLNAPYNAEPTSYLLVTEPATALPKVQEVIDDLQSIYGFTDQQIEDFKENWINVQGR